MSLLAPTPPDFALSPHRRPADAQRAWNAAGGSAVFAGGATALQLAWTAGGAPAPQTLIPVAACAGSIGISRDGPWLRLGAADSLEAVRSHALVRAHAPLLAAACDRIGSLALRRLGTLGGNLGWRFGDATGALLALDAQALDARDQWRCLSEVLALPRLPLLVALRVRSEAAADWRYEKLGGRLAFSPTRLSLAMACMGAASLDDTPGPAEGGSPRADGPRWRMAAGGAGLPVRRLWRVESLLADSPGALPDPVRLRDACVADLDGDRREADRDAGPTLEHLVEEAVGRRVVVGPCRHELAAVAEQLDAQALGIVGRAARAEHVELLEQAGDLDTWVDDGGQDGERPVERWVRGAHQDAELGERLHGAQPT